MQTPNEVPYLVQDRREGGEFMDLHLARDDPPVSTPEVATSSSTGAVLGELSNEDERDQLIRGLTVGHDVNEILIEPVIPLLSSDRNVLLSEGGGRCHDD